MPGFAHTGEHGAPSGGSRDVRVSAHHPATMAEGQEGRAVLTVEEAGRLLGVSRGLAYEAVRRGEIPSVRIGRRILVPAAALRTLLGEGE